jgi:hypothetical protein
MNRRRFLRLAGAAAAVAPGVGASATSAPGATVLYEDRTIPLTRVLRDPGDGRALWVRKADLPRINGFEIKPQGACRADICIPITKQMQRRGYFSLTAFARTIGEPVVADVGAGVWSFGEIQTLRGGFLKSRVAPDFTVADRRGRPVHLTDFRGKRVLLLTWASW